MNPCISPEQFERLLSAQLSPAERTALDAHVDVCGQCQKELARLLDGSAHEATEVYWQLLRGGGPAATANLPDDFLRRLKEARPASQVGMVRILCPHCRDSIEIAKVTIRENVVCPACGSSFRLEEQTTTGWSPGNGRKIGRFDVLDTVGQGAFGTVYKARDAELERIVAIKVPRAELTGGESMDRFLREARSVAQLRHPSIVPVYEVGQEEQVPYLVSEFVQGITLADRLTDRPPPPFRESAEIVAVLADALQYAHEMGVVLAMSSRQTSCSMRRAGHT
jgi:hypothetical protein